MSWRSHRLSTSIQRLEPNALLPGISAPRLKSSLLSVPHTQVASVLLCMCYSCQSPSHNLLSDSSPLSSSTLALCCHPHSCARTPAPPC